MTKLTTWLHDNPTVARAIGLGLVVVGYTLAGDHANAMQAMTALLVLFGVPALGMASYTR